VQQEQQMITTGYALQGWALACVTVHKDHKGRLPLCYCAAGLQEGCPHYVYACFDKQDIVRARCVRFHNESVLGSGLDYLNYLNYLGFFNLWVIVVFLNSILGLLWFF
jgi:hypothetical protein